MLVPTMTLKWPRISSVRLDLTIVTSPGVGLSKEVIPEVIFTRFCLVCLFSSRFYAVSAIWIPLLEFGVPCFC